MLKIKQADHKDVAFGVHNLDLGFCIVLGTRVRRIKMDALTLLKEFLNFMFIVFVDTLFCTPTT